jgi:hypothetical protein
MSASVATSEASSLEEILADPAPPSATKVTRVGSVEDRRPAGMVTVVAKR